MIALVVIVCIYAGLVVAVLACLTVLVLDLRNDLEDLRVRFYCLSHNHKRLTADWQATDLFARNHTHPPVIESVEDDDGWLERGDLPPGASV